MSSNPRLPMDNQQYDHIIAYLRQQYPRPFFERDGQVYPVVVDPPDMTRPDGDQVDSILGYRHDEFTPPTDFAFYDYAYLHTLQNRHPSLYNGVTFVLAQIKRKQMKVDVRLGYYYDMLATCATLQNELEAAATSRFIRLPARTQLHQRIDPIPAMNRGVGRSAAIGVAVLVVFHHAGNYRAFIAQRGANNATDSGRYHLLPAFIFQPRTADVQAEEWSIEYHIWREYLEELFGVEEHNLAWQAHPAYADIQRRLRAGTASLHFTGIATNLMTLRPEICALLLIHEEDWYAQVSNPHSPLALNAHAEAHNGQIQIFDIHTDEALYKTLPTDLHLRMPAQGAVAFWLGIDRAREIIAMLP